MWRDLEEVATADSGLPRRSRIIFEPDWKADTMARSSKPSTNGKRRPEPDVVGVPLVNPPGNAFIIVDTSAMLPFYPEPQPVKEPRGGHRASLRVRPRSHASGAGAQASCESEKISLQYLGAHAHGGRSSIVPLRRTCGRSLRPDLYGTRHLDCP